MSEDLAVGTMDAPSGGDIAPTPDISTTASDSASQPETPAFDMKQHDFSAAFGLKPSPDVPEVPDPPVIHQDAEVKTDAPDAATEAKTPSEAAPDAVPDAQDVLGLSDKLDFSTAPKAFRDELARLQTAQLELVSNSVENLFLTNPSECKKWMEDKSPTSYTEIGSQIGKEFAQRSAETEPQPWIDFFVTRNPDAVAKTLTATNPDMVTEMLTGRPGLTADRLKAELELMIDDDDPDLAAKLAEIKAAKAADKPVEAPVETQEQREIREFREERQQEKVVALTNEVMRPIEDEINGFMSQAGLEIDESEYKGKDFFKLDPDVQYKAIVSEAMPLLLGAFIANDPKTAHLQDRLEHFLSKGDRASAMAMQHQARIAATNYAAKILEHITGKRAEASKAATQSPTNDKPQPMVRSANGSNAVAAVGNGSLDWKGAAENFLKSRG